MAQRRPAAVVPRPLDILVTSTLVVAVAELGDKTQLLAILLVCRYGRPWTIGAGILAATVANHGLAALLGVELAGWLDGPWFQLLVGGGFLAMALWALVPDRLDEGEEATVRRGGAFLATLIAFFLVEIGDKTQIATIALAARYEALWLVTAGTTLGMMLANLPALLLGRKLIEVLPLASLRIGAALLFALLGGWVLFEAWQGF